MPNDCIANRTRRLQLSKKLKHFGMIDFCTLYGMLCMYTEAKSYT